MRAGRPGRGRRPGHAGDRRLRAFDGVDYNKVPRPPVVFVRDGRWRVVVRRETYEDLLALDA